MYILDEIRYFIEDHWKKVLIGLGIILVIYLLWGFLHKDESADKDKVDVESVENVGVDVNTDEDVNNSKGVDNQDVSKSDNNTKEESEAEKRQRDIELEAQRILEEDEIKDELVFKPNYKTYNFSKDIKFNEEVRDIVKKYSRVNLDGVTVDTSKVVNVGSLDEGLRQYNEVVGMRYSCGGGHMTAEECFNYYVKAVESDYRDKILEDYFGYYMQNLKLRQVAIDKLKGVDKGVSTVSLSSITGVLDAKNNGAILQARLYESVYNQDKELQFIFDDNNDISRDMNILSDTVRDIVMTVK